MIHAAAAPIPARRPARPGILPVLLALALLPSRAAADEMPKGVRLALEVWTHGEGRFVREIWLVQEGSAERLLAPENDQGVGDPCLSPDGKRIAYTFGPEERSGVAMVDLDGKAHQVLLAPRSAADDPGVIERAFHHPRIHPSGEGLIVSERVHTRVGDGAGARESVESHLHWIDFKSGAAQRLAVDRPIRAEALAWSKDGAKILLRGSLTEDCVTESRAIVCWGKRDGDAVAVEDPFLPGVPVRTGACRPKTGDVVLAFHDAAKGLDAIVEFPGGDPAKSKPVLTLTAQEQLRTLACGLKDDVMAMGTSSGGTMEAAFWFRAGKADRFAIALAKCPGAVSMRDPSWGPATGGGKPVPAAQAEIPASAPKLPARIGLEPCVTCKAKGEVTVSCSACGGGGSMPCIVCKGNGGHACGVCGATGRRRLEQGEVPCEACGARGAYGCGWCGGKKQANCMLCRGKKTIVKACPECRGLEVSRGARPAGERAGCPACGGFAFVQCKDCAATGQVPGPCPACYKGLQPCPQCMGAYKVKCETCYGKGKTPDPKGTGNWVKCRDCNERGWMPCGSCKNGAARDGICQGRGQQPRTVCAACVGSGNVPCPLCGERTD